MVKTFWAGHAVTHRTMWGRYEVLEGAATEEMAILEFPTYEEAKAWSHSPVYREASKHRFLGTDYPAILVEGV
jgi:uncharacterized protein (DUF1330 family)